MHHRVDIVGRLGADPELQYTTQGTALTKFSVATSEKWKDQQGNKQERTMWWRIEVWGPQAEPCNQYLAKGSLVFVEGQMVSDPATGGPRQWTDNDGNTRTSFQLKARSVKFLGAARQGGGQNQQQSRPASTPVSTPAPDSAVTEDEIPF